MSKNIAAISVYLFVLSAFSSVSLLADEVQEMKLDGTVRVYPKEFQAYDLLYVQVELQNKNDKPMKSWKSFKRDFGCIITLFGESKDDCYTWPYDGAIDWGFGIKSTVEPNESFVVTNTFLEFPEYITLQGFRSEEYPDIHKKFIEEYVGTGKTCTLRIALEKTGTFDSEPIEIKSRDEKEMAAIEAWYSRFENYLSGVSRCYFSGRGDEIQVVSGNSVIRSIPKDEFQVLKRNGENEIIGNLLWKEVPTVKDYEDFENQLSDGTLKNYIHFRKLLASIPDSKKDDTAPIADEPFLELKDYLDTLHPLERGVLTDEAIKYFERIPGGNNQKMKEIFPPAS